MFRLSSFLVFAVTSILSVAVCLQVVADDKWTQWGGDHRDFSVDNLTISENPKLKEVWRRDLGNGYSAILCEDERLYTMYRKNDDEFIICLNRADGKTIWEQSYSAPLSKDADASFGKGPNATPMIVGDLLICIGFNGDLHCMNKADGQIVWKKNLISEHGGTEVGLGYSASPLHYRGNIILPVGGKGKGLMAFSVKNGSVVWSSLDYDNSYGTPLLYTENDVDQLVFASTMDVISVNPENGEELWSFPLKNQWDCHAFVPVWDAKNKMLFISSFRQSHGLNIQCDASAAKKVAMEKKWSDERSGIGFTNAVVVGDIVIGSTGGSRTPVVTAFDSVGGSVLWKERGFGKSNFLAVQEHLLLLDEKGNFAVAKPSDAGLNVVMKEQVLSAEKAWTVPTLVGNTLYMRDQKEIVAMEIN